MTRTACTILPDFIEDRNGNQITITDNSNGAFTVTDTLGRPAIQSNGFGSNGNTVTVDGLGGNYTVDLGTVSSSYSVGAKQLGIDKYCNGMANEGGSTPVVTSITLPNNQSYTFAYDTTYGLLNQITYPSGAWVKYTWGLNAQSEFGTFADSYGNAQACAYTYGSPAVVERQVSFNGTTVALVQTFSYTTTWGNIGNWTQKITAVSTTDNLRNTAYTTAYTYSPISLALPPNDLSLFSPQVPVEAQIVYKDWNGSPLSTVTKAWQDQYLMTQQRTTPAGGGTAEKDYTYMQLNGLLAWWDLLTDEKDYDYASSPPAPCSRKPLFPTGVPPTRRSLASSARFTRPFWTARRRSSPAMPRLARVAKTAWPRRITPTTKRQ
jgi:hypothetical protein